MLTPAFLAIVDDDDDFRTYLQVMLRGRGYTVEAFSSGAGLLESIARGLTPDVVLLDVLMPGLNGMETLRAVREAASSTQVIMLSGQDVPATIVETVRAGAVDYVVKPDDPDGLGEAALESAICSCLERRTLSTEVARLRADLSDEPDSPQPSWRTSHVMQRVLSTIERVADSDVTVLITGESGVGKEVVARELHRRSGRHARPFVKVNCAALPAELLESELFGHERGAFTGAQTPRIGKFEHAAGGTIFLDEIGEMPLALQPKLLHVLQDGTLTKLGSNRSIQVDTRVIAATNRPLAEMIRLRQFREDLYYRLQVIEIAVPSLRDRRDEIPSLTDVFLARYSTRYGRPAARPSDRMRHAFARHDWPGNVRELENLIKRYVILQDEDLVLRALDRAEPIAAEADPEATPVTRVDRHAEPVHARRAPDSAGLTALSREAALAAERDAIQHALTTFRWNRRQAAKMLGVSYKTLLNKMKACGFALPAESAAP